MRSKLIFNGRYELFENATLYKITENGKRRTGSALYANTGRGKPTEQYNTKPAPAKAVRLVFAISVWKSLVRPRRDAGRMPQH